MRQRMPLSETGVSQRLSTCNLVKCSAMSCNPRSPNWVHQRFKQRSDVSLQRSFAQELVTFVNASDKHSRLPKLPEQRMRERSASVDFDGRVSFLGPPFACYTHIHTEFTHMQFHIYTHTKLTNIQMDENKESIQTEEYYYHRKEA